MRKAKKQREPDWLDRILDELQARKEQGESPSLVYLLEALLNELMKRERKTFLEQHPQEKANGFYRRSLRLTMGELKLSVPRVRYGHTFRPSILPGNSAFAVRKEILLLFSLPRLLTPFTSPTITSSKCSVLSVRQGHPTTEPSYRLPRSFRIWTIATPTMIMTMARY